MEIRHRILFFLQKVYKDGEERKEGPIRMRVSWNTLRLQINVGYSISPDKWDNKAQRVKKSTTNKNKDSAFNINKEIQRLENLAEDIFKAFEVSGHTPTLEEYKEAFNRAEKKDRGEKEESREIGYYLTLFMSETGKEHSWSDATYNKFRALGKHLKKFRPDLKLEQLTKPVFSDFADYLLNDADMKNTTIIKNIKFIKWFLGWAVEKGHLTSTDWKEYEPKFKKLSNKVIYLEWDELMKLYECKFPEEKKYLDRARDLFCFCCFTSLRYSDAVALTRSNIDLKNGVINVVTQKTDTRLTIDLNKYSTAILKKYQNEVYDKGKALPGITNQRANEYIKEACFVAGIDTPIETEYYKGVERIKETTPKYKLIGTHSGRRTFICNALIMGIPASTVMQWTGHTDYKSMQPYISVADSARKEAMSKFNEL
ncbi:site-specific integrase [Parabacteroides sp. PF5-9]|uniref:site-specific integrase n=1 Tax=Parabacteroides sp. PF5-9 TaxID=1742404 RepID=UPI002474F212|nr:site-specific integrase [Parabacteroides sp. PF5-9]MDH6357612.1 integrase [Parabacteroides sp. PF5-9]